MSVPAYQVWRASFLVRALWFFFRRHHYRRVEGASRVYRALAPTCEPGVAEAAAEKYYQEHTGKEKPIEDSIDAAILDALTGGVADDEDDQ